MQIQLQRFPFALARRARRHHEATLRELAIVRYSASSALHPELERIRAVATELTVDLVPVVASAPAQLVYAIDSFDGTGPDGVVLDLDPEEVQALVQFLRLRTETDALARAGALLPLPMDDDIRAYYDWMCDEVRRQSDGAAPQPWTPPNG